MGRERKGKGEEGGGRGRQRSLIGTNLKRIGGIKTVRSLTRLDERR